MNGYRIYNTRITNHQVPLQMFTVRIRDAAMRPNRKHEVSIHLETGAENNQPTNQNQPTSQPTTRQTHATARDLRNKPSHPPPKPPSARKTKDTFRQRTRIIQPAVSSPNPNNRKNHLATHPARPEHRNLAKTNKLPAATRQDCSKVLCVYCLWHGCVTCHTTCFAVRTSRRHRARTKQWVNKCMCSSIH